MITSIEKTNATPKDQYARWKDEITLAEKELDDWWRRGKKIVKRYIDDRDAMQSETRKFNIFTTNVRKVKTILTGITR